MPIKISKAMREKLPEPERESIETVLWDKSGGVCFLCETGMNRSADDIEADHDVPERDNGPTCVSNLNLVHETCNRAKRASNSVDIRPVLKLKAFSREKGGRLQYDGYQEHFGIDPKPVVVARSGDTATFELPDGSRVDVGVLSETNDAGTFEYVFLQLPRDAIFNDAACQPRAVRIEHTQGIYADLRKNVLHEPPSCRMEAYATDRPVRLLMFDGQHKTIANWLMGRDKVTAKVYLNLTSAQAVLLVNSIQAKIKKLPLSPFELAGKMADEWENKFSSYEGEVGSTEVSEQGFLKWLGDEKARGKQALESALVQNVLGDPNLRIAKHVKRPGAPAPTIAITEQTLKKKVIERLLAMEAQSAKGEEAQEIRDREQSNVIMILNLLNDEAFEPTDPAVDLTAQEAERARRMTYQSSLQYLSSLIRSLWAHLLMSSSTKAPMSQMLSDDLEVKLRTGIKNMVAHPVWTADFGRDDKMKQLKVALEKNQEVPQSLEDLGLDLPYLLLGAESPSYKNHWTKA